MNIIVLDVHHSEDGRVNRHLRYMHSIGYNVVHFNINRYFPFLDEGEYSKYGEMGYRINLGNYTQTIKNRLKLLFLFMSPILSSKIFFLLKKTLFLSDSPIIIHVHDYELLVTAVFLRFILPGTKVIVYDRHEYLEIAKGEHRIFDKLPRFYEKITSRWINGLVDISDLHLEKIKRLFPHSQYTVVPNYPDDNAIKFSGFYEKVEKLESNDFSIVYFGSLNEKLDRDITLTLKIMESVLTKNPSSKAHIGGMTSDEELLKKMHKLEKLYLNRFFYLGFIPSKNVLEYTSKSTLGLFLLKPNNCSSGSSNKIYEYLRFGVIPIIKANIENTDILSRCSLIFSKNERDETVIATVCNLIQDKERMKQMMLDSYEIGKQYTFDNVKIRYQSLYLDLFHNLK